MSFWTFYWNYESPTCVGGSNQPLYLFASTVGGTVIANYQKTDFALLSLTEDPNDLACFFPFYLGWSRSTSPASSGTGIHHPRGDIKKVTLYNNPAVSNSSSIPWDDNTISPPNSHWVISATSGGMQGGSSGSPLLNQSKHVVGQLHGGTEEPCAPDRTSYYGRFDVSWDDGPSPQRRLKDWLDPNNLGNTFLNGIDDKPNLSIAGPSTFCDSTIYTLSNLPLGATVSWSADYAVTISPINNNSALAVVEDDDTFYEESSITAIVNFAGGCTQETLYKVITPSLPNYLSISYVPNGSYSILFTYEGQVPGFNPQNGHLFEAKSLDGEIMNLPNTYNGYITDHHIKGSGIYTSGSSSTMRLEVRYRNGCGWSEWELLEVEFSH